MPSIFLGLIVRDKIKAFKLNVVQNRWDPGIMMLYRWSTTWSFCRVVCLAKNLAQLLPELLTCISNTSRLDLVHTCLSKS